MSDKKKTAERIATANAATFALDLARVNIQKYLELHTGTSDNFIMALKGGGEQFKMLIGDQTRAQVDAIAQQSAKLAAENLQQFLDLDKDEP